MFRRETTFVRCTHRDDAIARLVLGEVWTRVGLSSDMSAMTDYPVISSRLQVFRYSGKASKGVELV